MKPSNKKINKTKSKSKPPKDNERIYQKSKTRKHIGGQKMPLLDGDNDSIFSHNKSFDENPFVRESHNCYMYFLNKKNNEVVKLCKKDYPTHKLCRRAQPGYISGYPLLKKQDYKCPKIMDRTLADNPNIYKIGENDKCIPSHYKGALVVAPHRDYHYYRENDDGQWTHKPGYKPSTSLDSNNNMIFNPRKAARDYGGTLNYKDFCTYLCVPRKDNKKRMGYWNYKYGIREGGGKGRRGNGNKKNITAKKTKSTRTKSTRTKSTRTKSTRTKSTRTKSTRKKNSKIKT